MKSTMYSLFITVLFSLLYSFSNLLAAGDSISVTKNLSIYTGDGDGWQLRESRDIEYLSNGQVDYANISYYSTNGQLDSLSYQTYSYDSRWNISSYIIKYKKPDSEWKNNHRYLNTYDNNDNVIRFDSQVWNDNINYWDTTEYSFIISEYNEFNKLTLDLYLLQSAKPIIHVDSSTKETLSYDNKNRNISDIYYKYGNGAWHISNSTSTIYNDTANSYIEYSSQFYNDSLYGFTKTEYVLNDSGEISTSTSFSSKDSGSTWENSRLELYEYDSKNRLTLRTTYYYEGNYWKEYYKLIYSYSDTATEYITLRSINGEWTNNRKAVWRFEKIKTSIDESLDCNIAANIDIFPNPASSFLNISYDLPYEGTFSLNIFDCSGKPCISLPVSNQSKGSHLLKLEVSDMPSGVYFCEFNFNGRKINRQFIICN